ncbi:MAG: riboflavin biosynthesis protein RibF [Clostridia bacterium]|nr:riboflavin biosynthesis protein RibF [Clostridia bacterium]
MTYLDLSTGKETLERPRTVLGLGNFDGVHLAHRELLESVVRLASRLEKSGKKENPETEIVPAVWCFERPSSDFLSKAPVGHLTTLEQRLELFRDAGIRYAVLDRFEDVRDMSPEQFIRERLLGECRCEGVVCGFNFRFGKGGAGTPETLRLTFDPCLVKPRRVCMGGVVSSSRIRWLIRAGDLELADLLLGRPFELTGVVYEGHHLGRELGVPTVNQRFGPDSVIPRRGIYVTQAVVDGNVYPAVSNVGFRPTVDTGRELNCETHILGFDREVYGSRISVRFLKRLRDEIRFETTEALRMAIQEDIRDAERYFSEHPV